MLDEAHRIKSPGSRVSLYCTALGKQVPYRMALTGTPAHNSPLDVYAQYRFLDPGIFGTNFSAFRDRYAVMGGYGGYQVIAYRVSPTLPDGQPNPYYSPKLDQEFQERMYSLAFRVRTGDVLDLPPEMDEERRFDLSDSARKIYTKLYRDMVAGVGSGKVTVANALTRLLRLQQITSGFLPVEDNEDGTTNLQQIDTGKQELLADLLEDLPACDRCPDPGRRHWVRPSALGQAGGTRIVVMSERPYAGIGAAPRSDAAREEREWQGCEAGDRRGAGRACECIRREDWSGEH